VEGIEGVELSWWGLWWLSPTPPLCLPGETISKFMLYHLSFCVKSSN